jgi:hypothetical protein
MRSRRIARPSPALVVALVALFVAMGGTGYAAFVLPSKSVGAKHLKRGAVNSSKVKDGSLKAGDFGAGQFPAGAAGAVGPQGSRGAAGAAGADGSAGPRGPSDVYSAAAASGNSPVTATLAVPAGDYMASGKASAFNSEAGMANPDDGGAFCQLTADNDADHQDILLVTVPGTGFTTNQPSKLGVAALGLQSAFHLPNGGTISLTCGDAPQGDEPGMDFTIRKLDAIRVGALH